MTNRTNVTMTIGGRLPSSLFEEFCCAVRQDRATIDWDGSPLIPEEILSGEALFLFGLEIAWGEFPTLERFCQDHCLPYSRWAGGCAGSFGPERMVFNGHEPPRHYVATDDDEILFGIDELRRLDSLAAIEAEYAFANELIRPFFRESDPVASTAEPKAIGEP